MTSTPRATAAGGCPVGPRNLPRPSPISVNGVAITRGAIAREAQNHPAGKPIEAWLAAARALVVRELLLQEAGRLAIEAAPLADADGRRETDDEARIRALIEREAATPEADEATCRRCFEQNRPRFRSPDLFAVRHILCAAAPGDASARDGARRLAERLIDELAAHPSCFAGLATAHSACPSRTVGGSLGQVSSGQTVPEFEAALQRLVPGEIAAKPVETRYGFHVVLLEARADGEPLPFEAVKSRIAEWLAEKARRTAISQYIAMLAGRAEISGIELDQANALLVR